MSLRPAEYQPGGDVRSLDDSNLQRLIRTTEERIMEILGFISTLEDLERRLIKHLEDQTITAEDRTNTTNELNHARQMKERHNNQLNDARAELQRLQIEKLRREIAIGPREPTETKIKREGKGGAKRRPTRRSKSRKKRRSKSRKRRSKSRKKR